MQESFGRYTSVDDNFSPTKTFSLQASSLSTDILGFQGNALLLNSEHFLDILSEWWLKLIDTDLMTGPMVEPEIESLTE